MADFPVINVRRAFELQVFKCSDRNHFALFVHALVAGRSCRRRSARWAWPSFRKPEIPYDR